MENLKTSTKVILTEIAKRYPDSTEFRKQQIVDVAESLGYSGKVSQLARGVRFNKINEGEHE